MTLVSTVGGASGPLFGTLFLRMGAVARRHAERHRRQQLAAALRAGLDGVVARGKAEPGDKTMYDALAPAVDALDAALAERADAGRRAAAAPAPRPTRAATRPSRCWPARAGPATSASAASATRTRARPASRCCCRRPPSRGVPSHDRRRHGVGIVVVSHSRALAARRGRAGGGDAARPRRCGSRSPPGWTTRRSAPTPSQIKEAIERGRRPGRRRGPDGPRQRGAQRRARPRPARRPDGPRPGRPVARRRSSRG